jgi:hypothetical protein
MRIPHDLSHYEQCLVDLYKNDPGVTYSLNDYELRTLMSLVGEDECIVDAILKLGGASKEERAEQLGLQVSDFDHEDFDAGINVPSEDEQREQWRSLWTKEHKN